MVRRKTTGFFVQFGARGVSRDFKTMTMAKAFAKKKANKLRETVFIQKITRFPDAEPGETDFSQRQVASVKPSKMKLKVVRKKRKATPRRTTGGILGGFRF